MWHPNIQLDQKNMVIIDDCFYSFDHILKQLYKLNANGVVIKAYHVIGMSDNEINYTVYDGFNFWTLEDYVGDEDYGVIIKKWIIEKDCFCKLLEERNFTARSTKVRTNVINDSFTDGSYTDTWVVENGSFEESGGKLFTTGHDQTWNNIFSSFFYVFDFTVNIELSITVTSGDSSSNLYILFLDDSDERIGFRLSYNDIPLQISHGGYIDGVCVTSTKVTNKWYNNKPNILKIERTNFEINYWFNGELIFSLEKNLRVRINKFEFQCKTISSIIYFDKVKFSADQGTHKFKSKTFALEYYNTSFKTEISEGSSYVTLEEPYDWVIDSGDVFTLGPNKDGMSEIITVSGYLGNGTYGHPFYTTYGYEKGDPISIAKHIWLFNDYSALEDEGALYKCNANTNEVKIYYRGNNYRDVLSCTFSKITQIKQLDDPYCLLYTSGLTIKFLDIYDIPNTYCSMLIDNFNGSEIFDVYAICIDKGSIYRLQKKIYYFGSVYTDFYYSDYRYNFQRSPLRNFIETLSFSADPIILPNTGFNRSKLICLVKDQYSKPVSGALVTFLDTSDTGYIMFPEFNTNTHGQGITYYVSGIEIDTITLTVEVTQVDYIEYGI